MASSGKSAMVRVSPAQVRAIEELRAVINGDAGLLAEVGTRADEVTTSAVYRWLLGKGLSAAYTELAGRRRFAMAPPEKAAVRTAKKPAKKAVKKPTKKAAK